MKKQLFAALSLGALALVGCKKEEPTPVELGNAVVSGRLTADLDLSNDVTATGAFVEGLNPEGISGVQVSVRVNTANWDLNPDNSYSYPEKVYTATTDANGNYTLNIPCNTKAFNVNIEFGDIVKTQTQYEPNATTPHTKEVEFSFGTLSTQVFSGANSSANNRHASESDVNNSDITDDLGSHDISGTIRLNYDTTNDTLADGSFQFQYEAIPAGTMITCVYQTSYNGSSQYQGQAPNGGTLSIEIPVNSDGSYSATLPVHNSTGGFSNVRFYLPELLVDRKYFIGGGMTETEQAVYTSGPHNVNSLNNGGITIDRNFDYLP